MFLSQSVIERMWYATAGILLVTVVLLNTLLLAIKGVFHRSPWPHNVPTSLLLLTTLPLTAVLYFIAVEDTQNPEAAAQRGAIAGGVLYAVLGLLYGLSTVKEVRQVIVLPLLMGEFLAFVGEGAALSFVAAGTTVALNKLL